MVTLTIDPLAVQVTTIGTLIMSFRFLYVTSKLGFARLHIGGKAPEDSWLTKKLIEASLAKPAIREQQDFGVINELAIENKPITAAAAATQTSEEETQAQLAKAFENFHRWDRIMGNDHENVPFGLAVSFGTLICNGNPTAHVVGLIMFVVGRIGHTISYSCKNQPLRSTFFLIAFVGVHIMLINGILGAFALGDSTN